MAVNELERDYLAMLHQCDMIDNVIAGLKMENETAEQQRLKKNKRHYKNW